ncbi:hypothetical protein [Kitasatospora camelliae]|uniref:Flagellar FliJ protein n=1 Tax=Kitasatospora camelliae TaxID=3156397 RepID=A0AAU8K4N7_9ACTN
MFGRKQRRIRALKVEVADLTRALRLTRQQRDEQRDKTAEWHNRAERFGDDRIASERRLAQHKLGQAAAELRGKALLRRALTAHRAYASRQQRIIQALQTDLRRTAVELRAANERTALQDRQLATLQTANEAHYRDLQQSPQTLHPAA